MNNEFRVHMLNESGKERARQIAEAFDELLVTLLKHCPPGREMSLVRTHLETACFFAKKSMAITPGNTE